MTCSRSAPSLYELLCRRQAFPGNLDSGVLGRIMYQQPDPVEQQCPGIDPAVVRIVQTALQKEASNRYPDLVAMRRELQRVHRHLSSRPDLQVTAAPDETTVVIDQQTPVRTPRRGTAASEFGKRREAQIELHLQEATAALAASDYEQVIAACERALLMDPNLERAAEMLEQARTGLDKRQAERWLAEGQDELRRGGGHRRRPPPRSGAGHHAGLGRRALAQARDRGNTGGTASGTRTRGGSPAGARAGPDAFRCR